MELNTYQEYLDLFASTNETESYILLYTPWCSKCKIIKKKLESIPEYSGHLYYINIDSDGFIDHKEFNEIAHIPEMWIISNGKKEICSHLL